MYLTADLESLFALTKTSWILDCRLFQQLTPKSVDNLMSKSEWRTCFKHAPPSYIMHCQLSFLLLRARSDTK